MGRPPPKVTRTDTRCPYPTLVRSVLLGPANVHAQQHLRPVLRLGAAGAGVDLEVAVVGVGLAGQQAFELALGDARLQGVELALRLVEAGLVALVVAELGQRPRVLQLAVDCVGPLNRVPPMGAPAPYPPGTPRHASPRGGF